MKPPMRATPTKTTRTEPSNSSRVGQDTCFSSSRTAFRNSPNRAAGFAIKRDAGAAGVEPAVPVLETGGLPLTDAPPPAGRLHHVASLRLLVRRVPLAPLAVFAQLKALGHVLLILAAVIVAALALRARQRGLLLRHFLADSV